MEPKQQKQNVLSLRTGSELRQKMNEAAERNNVTVSQLAVDIIRRALDESDYINRKNVTSAVIGIAKEIDRLEVDYPTCDFHQLRQKGAELCRSLNI